MKLSIQMHLCALHTCSHAGLLEIAVTALALGSSAPSSCSHILSGPHPNAGWLKAAAVMDRAAFNIYSGSMHDASKAHAVCCTTLNTTLVSQHAIGSAQAQAGSKRAGQLGLMLCSAHPSCPLRACWLYSMCNS